MTLFYRVCAPRLAAGMEVAVVEMDPAILKVFSTLHCPTLSWASVPLLPGTLALLSGGGFRNCSEVTIVAQDGTEHTAPALDASTAALKFRMPDVPGPHLCVPLCTTQHNLCTPSALRQAAICPSPALYLYMYSSAPSLQAPLTSGSMAARRYLSTCPICARPQVRTKLTFELSCPSTALTLASPTAWCAQLVVAGRCG